MKEFNEIYQEVYKNSGEEINTLKNKTRTRNIILILLGIGCFILTIYAILTVTLWIYFIDAVIMVIIAVVVAKTQAKYTKLYKEKVIKQFVKAYSEQFEYYPENGVTRSEYNEAGFDGYYDRYHSDDLIKGTILNSCKLEMSEVHTQREDTTTDSDGHTTTTYVTVFHGLFAKITLDKSFHLNFKIVKNALFKNKKRLEMDSGEFEKIYDVITEDKIATLRVVTSEIMQLLLDFKNNYKVVPEIVFNGNNLYFRFGIGPVFEPNLIKNDMDYDKLKKNYDIINFTVKLTEDMSKHMIEFEE